MLEGYCEDEQDIWDNEICDDELLSAESSYLFGFLIVVLTSTNLQLDFAANIIQLVIRIS